MSDPTPHPAAMSAYGEHAHLIGTVAVAWGGAQESLYFIFVALMGMQTLQAEAIFFALRNDGAQREITTSLAKVVLHDNDELMERVITSINALGILAGERNAAIHTMWRASLDDGSIRPSPNVKHHPSLRPDHQAQFQQLADKLADLDRAMFELFVEVRQHLELLGRYPKQRIQPKDSR